MENLGHNVVVHDGCDHIFFVGFLGAGKSTLARNLGDRENAERVYAYRRPLYEQTADITIDIRNKSFTEVAAASGQLLWERGLL